MEGFYDTTGPDGELFESLGNEKSVMIVPDGDSPGDVAHIVPVTVSGYTPLSGSVGDLAAFSYAAQGDGIPYRGRVLEIRENIHSNHTSNQVQLGAIPAGQRMRVFVHAKRSQQCRGSGREHSEWVTGRGDHEPSL